MERFRYLAHDAFYGEARALRRVLDARLADTRDPFDAARFSWERWHVPRQFSQLRAPARAIFGEALSAWEAALLRALGRELGGVELGGPPWLSILTDRDFQALHRDSPNGDFAFSFGLGHEARYRGGETLVARDELLDYFGTGAHRDEEASAPLFDEIASRFNRLVVFDARLPHAVQEVEGPREPRSGRIAIQGWVRAKSSGLEPAALAELARAVRGAKLRSDLEGIVTVGLERTARGVRATLRAHTLAGRGGPREVSSLANPLLALAERADLPRGARGWLVFRVRRGKVDLVR